MAHAKKLCWVLALVEGGRGGAKGGKEDENEYVLHLAAALTSVKWYHILFLHIDVAGASCTSFHFHEWYFIFFLQSDAGEVRRRAARKGPRSNNSPTKGLLTTPGDLVTLPPLLKPKSR